MFKACGCTLFEAGSVCTSQCATCGVLCAAFPITDSNTLALYQTKGCTTVVGDLYITNLPVTVTKRQLQQNLQSVQYIRGGLYVEGNLFLNAMVFLSNLLGVESIYYENMPILADTRMPLLQQLSGDVTVVGCDRLCPARYTVVGPSPNQAGCANSTINWYMFIVGPVAVDDVDVLVNVSARVFTNVTGGGVCHCSY